MRLHQPNWMNKWALVTLPVLLVSVMALSKREVGKKIIVEIPPGASSGEVAYLLKENEIIASAVLFRAYVKLRGEDRSLKAGIYKMQTSGSIQEAFRKISRGVVETTAITIPEGLNVWQIAPILSEVTQNTEDEITIALKDPMLPERFNLEGPTIEGYLFPDTYRFANGISLETVITTMIEQYRSLWTDARKKALEASGMSEHEIVTLASIIQTEARQLSEMSRISGVYHNRIRDRWLLQADPTVIYALGGYRERLLYAAIDSVADNPYNTYTQPGLPPGPIASPGAMAIDAALTPEEHDYWYFVARPDGSHVFTSTLADHNRAKEEQRIARNGL
ncbi:MAG TPA: endolytic transglycosylase MltG [Gemmatimonadetes bacterium]|nr:hypothetical protein [Gemmatimonadota bacterium]HBV05482.1 endolytic transglycosylase MltG [Gemmatimonadota bacterium]|tara:strand:- start:912 stop:1916 length:1005 start_codon:yes stop_codon:yes gene_type:complete